MLRGGNADVFGADAGLIPLIASGYPETKIVAGAFHIVRVALALPKGRSSAAQAKLHEIVKESKQSGIVQRAIEQAGLRSGVRIAPE
jgi:polar amino acid transport system substrate-binding protein